MKQVNVHYAKTHLSKLLEDASAGEEVVIAKAGKPVARLVPIGPNAKRGRGILKERMPELAKALEANPHLFLEPMSEEELRLWEGKGSSFDITP